MDKTDLVYKMTHTYKFCFLSRPCRFGMLPSQIGSMDAFASSFDAPTERMGSLTPLLYQSGYLTIKGHYQQLLYIIFSLLGMYVDVEVRTSRGRVDMVMRTSSRLYLFELKVGQSAEAAMRQIDLKDYAKRFSLCGLPIVKVAIDFDLQTRTLSGWKVA